MSRSTLSMTFRPIAVWTLLAAIVVSASGCLAPYDQVSDESITSIQKRLDSHIDSLARATTDQPVDVEFFTTLRSDLRALKLRTEARGDDASLERQAKLLDEILLQVNAIEELARDNLRGDEAWETARSGLTTNIKGFLTVELARKSDGL